MSESHGELLIGGMTLHHVRVQLMQEEAPRRKNSDWLLSGRIRVSPKEGEELEVNRHYLLQLEDGRAGPIMLTEVQPVDGTLEAAFQPHLT